MEHTWTTLQPALKTFPSERNGHVTSEMMNGIEKLHHQTRCLPTLFACTVNGAPWASTKQVSGFGPATPTLWFPKLAVGKLCSFASQFQICSAPWRRNLWRDSIVEVTIAHKHTIQDEHLEIFMYDRSTVAAPVGWQYERRLWAYCSIAEDSSVMKLQSIQQRVNLGWRPCCWVSRWRWNSCCGWSDNVVVMHVETLRAGCSALGHLSLQSYQTPPSAATSQLRMDRSDQTKQSMVIHQNLSSLQMQVFRCWKYFSCGWLSNWWKRPKDAQVGWRCKAEKLNKVTSTDLSLYEHEDDPLSFAFNNDELDELEEYELNFSNDEL